MRRIRLLRFIKMLFRRYVDDEVPAYSAQMAYYFLLAFFPFLIFLITIIGYLPISDADILEPLASFLPAISYHVLQENVEQVVKTRNMQLLSFGFVAMLWASSNGMRAIMRGINKALCRDDRMPFWISVPLSIGFTILVTLLIVFYFVLLIFGEQIGELLVRAGMKWEYWKGWDVIRYMTAVLIMIGVFTILFRYSPCKRIKWRNALPGAVFTTVGWLLISLIFTFYVNRFWDPALVYGNLGGIIALLIWLFISAQLIILGGEVNAILIFNRKDRVGKSGPRLKNRI